jgi:glycosyl transferase family 25
MQSIVISLRRMPERRALVETQFTNAGIAFEYFDAIDAAEPDYLTRSRYDEKLCLSRFGMALTPGEIACYASHYAVWQLCVARNCNVVIYEDDVVLGADFPAVLSMAEELIDEHRFIRLYAMHDRRFRRLKALGSRHALVRYLHGPMGCQCYCLSPAGAAALLAKADRWAEPVDHYVDYFWRHGLASKAIWPFELQEMDRRAITGAIGHRPMRLGRIAKLRRELSRFRINTQRIAYNLRHLGR